jgi:hypothetical protein
MHGTRLGLDSSAHRYGTDTTYDDLPIHIGGAFVTAARVYAQAIIQYPLKKHGNLRNMQDLVIDELPFAEAYSWTGEPMRIVHREWLGTLYYAVFGEVLTNLRLAQIICGE